jgi:hypothetical protein
MRRPRVTGGLLNDVNDIFRSATEINDANDIFRSATEINDAGIQFKVKPRA